MPEPRSAPLSWRGKTPLVRVLNTVFDPMRWPEEKPLTASERLTAKTKHLSTSERLSQWDCFLALAIVREMKGGDEARAACTTLRQQTGISRHALFRSLFRLCDGPFALFDRAQQRGKINVFRLRTSPGNGTTTSPGNRTTFDQSRNRH